MSPMILEDLELKDISSLYTRRFLKMLNGQVESLDLATLIRLRALLDAGEFYIKIPMHKLLEEGVDEIINRRVLSDLTATDVTNIEYLVEAIFMRALVSTMSEADRRAFGIEVQEGWNVQSDESCMLGSTSEIPSVGETGSENDFSHDQILIDDESVPVF